MFGKKPFLICLLIITSVSGCAVATYEHQPVRKIKDYVTSNPSEANVYWKMKFSDETVGPIGKTPFSRTISEEKIRFRCYQVKKDGYYDSNVICRYAENDDRHFHFDLRPVEQSAQKPIFLKNLTIRVLDHQHPEGP